MAISSEVSAVAYTGNGATVDFDVPFYFFVAGALVVRVTPDGGVESTKVLGTHYTVAGAGSEDGGTVTFLVAPADDAAIVIERNVPIIQGTDFTEQGSFSPRTHEEALDYRTMVDQQLARRVAVIEGLGAGADVGLGGPPLDVNTLAAAAGSSGLAAHADHKHKVQVAAAIEISDSTNAQGNATELAAANHVHAHGVRGGGTLHAASTTAEAGFQSAKNKYKSESFIHVNDYGAVGDGTTDDYAAIMLALNAAWAQHKPLHFDAKPYAVGTEIDIPTSRHTILRGTQYVDGQVTTLKAIASMRAVLSLHEGIVMETFGIDCNRLALVGIYGQTCSLGTFKNCGVGAALRDGIYMAGENDTTVYTSGTMSLETARFLRADNRWVKSINQLAGVTCQIISGSPIIDFVGSVDLTTLGLEGGPNDPSTVILKSGDTIFRGVLSVVNSPTRLTLTTAPTFNAILADFLLNNFRHSINDTNSFYDVGCGGNGVMWVTAGANNGIYFSGIPKTVSTSTAAVSSASAIVNFSAGVDLYAMKLRYGDGLRVGADPWAANEVVAVGTTRYTDTRTYRCITAGTTAGSGGPTGTGSNITDGTAHWEYRHAGGLKTHMLIQNITSPTQLVGVNAFDFTGTLCDWAIASGDGYHECQSSDNNLNSFNGNQLWRGNANAHMSFKGFYGPYVLGQQMDYSGMYGITIGLGTVSINPLFLRVYNESSGSGKAYFLGTVQGIAIHQPLDSIGEPDDSIDYIGDGGSCFGAYYGRGGIRELGKAEGSYTSDIMTSRLGPNPVVTGMMSFGGHELAPDSPTPGGSFSTAGTTSFSEQCNLLNPGDVECLLTGTPTFALAANQFIFLTIKSTQSAGVTLQHDEFLAGTKLKLRSNRVDLRPGDSMLLFCNGTYWFEVGRTLDNTNTGVVASTQPIAQGQIVALVYDATAPGTLKRRAAALAEADGAGTLVNPVGVNPGYTFFAGSPINIQNAGEIHVPDAAWVGGVPAVTDVGLPAYLSETPGQWTMTPPATPGSTIIKMGTISVGGAGAAKVIIRIGEPTIAP